MCIFSLKMGRSGGSARQISWRENIQTPKRIVHNELAKGATDIRWELDEESKIVVFVNLYPSAFLSTSCPRQAAIDILRQHREHFPEVLRYACRQGGRLRLQGFVTLPPDSYRDSDSPTLRFSHSNQDTWQRAAFSDLYQMLLRWRVRWERIESVSTLYYLPFLEYGTQVLHQIHL